ncbi:unnamed protein product, partial [Protopolystoma xenopodis]
MQQQLRPVSAALVNGTGRLDVYRASAASHQQTGPNQIQPVYGQDLVPAPNGSVPTNRYLSVIHVSHTSCLVFFPLILGSDLRVESHRGPHLLFHNLNDGSCPPIRQQAKIPCRDLLPFVYYPNPVRMSKWIGCPGDMQDDGHATGLICVEPTCAPVINKSCMHACMCACVRVCLSVTFPAVPLVMDPETALLLVSLSSYTPCLPVASCRLHVEAACCPHDEAASLAHLPGVATTPTTKVDSIVRSDDQQFGIPADSCAHQLDTELVEPATSQALMLLRAQHPITFISLVNAYLSYLNLTSSELDQFVETLRRDDSPVSTCLCTATTPTPTPTPTPVGNMTTGPTTHMLGTSLTSGCSHTNSSINYSTGSANTSSSRSLFTPIKFTSLFSSTGVSDQSKQRGKLYAHLLLPATHLPPILFAVLPLVLLLGPADKHKFILRRPGNQCQVRELESILFSPRPVSQTACEPGCPGRCLPSSCWIRGVLSAFEAPAIACLLTRALRRRHLELGYSAAIGSPPPASALPCTASHLGQQGCMEAQNHTHLWTGSTSTSPSSLACGPSSLESAGGGLIPPQIRQILLRMPGV